jgi:hypothetical protein
MLGDLPHEHVAALAHEHPPRHAVTLPLPG